MKIIKIEVKKLFGIFDHEIPLKTGEHITIIHGPNGYGKTILLSLVNAVFNSKYSMLFKIPFKELIISFDDKSTLCVKKNIDDFIIEREKSKNGNALELEFSKPRLTPKTFKILPPTDLDPGGLPIPLRIIEREIPNLERIAPSLWLYLPTGEKFSLDDVLDRFADRLPFQFIKQNRKEERWFKEIKESIDIHFIEAQRLLRLSQTHINREFEARNSMVPAVLNYSKELAESIQEKLAEYGTLAQSLDRTFPTRLIKEKKKSGNKSDRNRLDQDLNELKLKRLKLFAVGLLEQEQGKDDEDLQKVDDSNIDVLSIYTKDVKEKLSIFDDLAEKIDLLVKIINNRFSYKQISINKKDGFVFKTPNGKTIPAVNLSSGEQHELVLLYEMLFKVKPNSLILIDEPELSLHVGWQQQFLKDLEQITRLGSFDVLMATHSPDVINERWDLTIELKGPQK
ncbi:MAG: AAA family ATPase [Acidobacteria bacterium]|nr:AAA family ATPase [Acidobacteriota bacterium]